MKPTQPAEAPTLDALYRGYHGWLLSWLRRRVQCSHQAADVAQDTFIRLLAAGTYVAPSEPQAYLATIARRLLMDGTRRRRLEQAYREELERCAAYLEQAPSPEQILQALQVIEAIDRALSQMKPRIRQTFVLRYLEGLDQAQIAARLGVTVRTVQHDLVDAVLACDACAQA